MSKKMTRTIILITAFALVFGCTMQTGNPLLKEWKTPLQTPPFNEIKNEHFMPAIQEGMRIEIAEVEEIINNSEKPTFKNTIEALEKSGYSH